MEKVIYRHQWHYITGKPSANLPASGREGNKGGYMEQITITIETMEDVRREIDNCQRKAMKSVVELGYILRKADDAGLYKEQGYTSIFTFAREEYGWSQSQTSRFMDINREFSEGGYSTTLKEQYKGFGQAKLAEMLTLPECVREELDPGMKRSEIREAKAYFREAEREEREHTFEAAVFSGGQEDGTKAAVEKLFSLPDMAKKLPGLYPYIKKAATGETVPEEDIRMAISNTGFGTIRAGSTMFFWKKDSITTIKGDHKSALTYQELINICNSLQDAEHLTLEEWYRNVYGKEFPKKEPVNKVPEAGPQKRTGEKKEKPLPHIETSTNTGDSEKSEPELEGKETIQKHTEKKPAREEKQKPGTIDREQQLQKPIPHTETSANGGQPEEPEGQGTQECPYCNGAQLIESNDGYFAITVYENGLTEISSRDGRHAVLELPYCPMCGRGLETDED